MARPPKPSMRLRLSALYTTGEVKSRITPPMQWATSGCGRSAGQPGSLRQVGAEWCASVAKASTVLNGSGLAEAEALLVSIGHDAAAGPYVPFDEVDGSGTDLNGTDAPAADRHVRAPALPGGRIDCPTRFSLLIRIGQSLSAALASSVWLTFRSRRS